MNALTQNIVRFLDENKTKIAFTLGGLLTIGGTVYCCKQTLNVPKLVEEHKERMKEAQMAVDMEVDVTKETGEATKVDNNSQKKMIIVRAWGKTIWAFAKNYGLPVGMEAAGLGLMTYSNLTLENQKVLLGLAVANGVAKYDQVIDYIRKNYGEAEAVAAQYGLEREVTKGKKGEPDVVTYKTPEEFSKFSVLIERKNDPTDRMAHDVDDGVLLAELDGAQQALNLRGEQSWDGKVSLAECYSVTRARPSSDEVLEESRIWGFKFDKRHLERDDRGIPNNIKIMVMTVWPTAELLPLDYLLEEHAQYVKENKPWNRLDRNAVWIDFKNPELIV